MLATVFRANKNVVDLYVALIRFSRPYGIFHLSNPGGVSLIRNCQERGFHEHGLPEDGSPLYKQCTHV